MKPITTKLAATIVAASILATAAPARAQGGDAALALSLFEDARQLAAGGNYEAACPKFLASYNQVQKLGTLLNLADCYEKQGKTASAWARFTEAQGLAERAGQQDRVEFAKTHAEALAPKLAKLTINVAAPPPGLEVKRDGAVVDPAAFGTPVPVDPGKHAIEAHAPGKKVWSTSVDVAGDGAKASVDVPALEAEAAPPPPPTTGPQQPAGQGPQTIIVYQGEQPNPGGAQRTWGVVVGSVGLLAVGVSMIGGLLAKKEYDKSNNPDNNGPAGACVNDVCTAQALQHRDDAHTIAGVATGVFIGGAVLLAGGVTLYLTAPSAKSAPRTSLRVGPGSLALGRTW